MEVIYDMNGSIVRKSHNLRGMLEHPNKARTWVKSVQLDRIGAHGGKLTVIYGNGDHTSTVFADFAVMLDFVMWRNSWIGADITIDGNAIGEHSVNLMRELVKSHNR